MIEQNMCTENKSLGIDNRQYARLLNATAIASGYTGRDSQGGTAIEAFR